MDAIELKSYIFINNHVEKILESIGCHHISSSQKEWRCGLPEHRSKTSVVIKKSETLKGKIYHSEDAIVSGDIITIVMDIKGINFPDALKYVHGILGLEYKKVAKKALNQSKTPLDIFKKIKRKGKRFDINEIAKFDESILEEYVPNLHISWLREGIISKTAREFNIGFDYKSKGIIIPHRAYNGDRNEFVGIIRRTTIEGYELFDIPKYFPLKVYPKGVNLYGLQENYKSIQEAGYVKVGEAEKYVLKRHSRLDPTCVALCCHDITDEQVRILIGLDVEVVIDMDKGVKEEHIWSMCDRFYGIRKVSYMYDKYDILEDKESFADKDNKIYNWAFKHRIPYDESKRREYLEWVREKTKPRCS